MKRMAVLLLMAVWNTVALGADWSSQSYLLPHMDLDTQLSATGRSACFSPGGTVHVLLRSRQENGLYRISETHEVSGRTWSEPVAVSSSGDVLHQSLDADSQGGLHAIWQDSEPFPSQVKYRYRNTDGVWEEETLLSPADEASQEPVLCVDSMDRIHCVWVQENPLASKLVHSWRNLGGEWSEPAVLDIGRTEVHEPTMDDGPAGTVHVVFVGRPHAIKGVHLFHLQGDFATNGLGAPLQLTPTESRPSLQDPFLEVIGDGTAFLSWSDNRGRAGAVSYDIYLKRLLSGVGWGHSKRVTRLGVSHGNSVIVGGPNHTWNMVFEAFDSGNTQVAYRQITREFGWDPEVAYLTGPLRPSQDPHVLPRPDGTLLLLWSQSDGNGVKHVHALEGTETGERQ